MSLLEENNKLREKLRESEEDMLKMRLQNQVIGNSHKRGSSHKERAKSVKNEKRRPQSNKYEEERVIIDKQIDEYKSTVYS